jgi:hypothetical protein
MLQASSNDEITRKALLYILSGNIPEAEKVLLQNGRIPHAVELNLTCCKFERY